MSAPAAQFIWKEWLPRQCLSASSPERSRYALVTDDINLLLAARCVVGWTQP